MCEGLSTISSYFTLHLIKVGKLKRFKKVSVDLKTILKTDLANLRFLELWKRRIISINITYVACENSLELTWSKKETVAVTDPGEWPGGPAPLILDQNEARRAEKNFFGGCIPPPPPHLILGSGSALGCVWSFRFLEEFKIYLSWDIS